MGCGMKWMAMGAQMCVCLLGVPACSHHHNYTHSRVYSGVCGGNCNENEEEEDNVLDAQRQDLI